MSRYKHDNNSRNNSNSGIGFTGLLTIAFIVLKLTNVIDWSWLWVLSPMWISFVILVIIIIISIILIRRS